MDTFLGLVSIAGSPLLLTLVLCSYQLRRRKYQQIANELGAAVSIARFIQVGENRRVQQS